MWKLAAYDIGETVGRACGKVGGEGGREGGREGGWGKPCSFVHADAHWNDQMIYNRL